MYTPKFFVSSLFIVLCTSQMERVAYLVALGFKIDDFGNLTTKSALTPLQQVAPNVTHAHTYTTHPPQQAANVTQMWGRSVPTWMNDAGHEELERLVLQPSSPIVMSKGFVRYTKPQKELLAKFPTFLDGVDDGGPPAHTLLFYYMSMHREAVFALVKAQFADVAPCDMQAGKLEPQFLKAIYKKYAVVLGMSYNQAHTRPHTHPQYTPHTQPHTTGADEHHPNCLP